MEPCSHSTISEPGIWFIYDGDCPLCNYAAHAFRIRQQCGELHLLDARSHDNPPLMAEIRRRGLDLDEGMVIIANGTYYHGATAMQFMAQFGDKQGMFNRINRWLFRSPANATKLYPWLRGVRNLLLRLRGRPPIRNLQD